MVCTARRKAVSRCGEKGKAINGAWMRRFHCASVAMTMNRRAFLAMTIATAATLLPANAAEDTRCFELRIYHATPGKLDALHARFRDHTCKLFEKHGMTNIGYWVPLNNPEGRLVYVLAYPSREARDASWKAFASDPDWLAAHKASEENGKLVEKVESKLMAKLPFSPSDKLKGEAPRTFELRTYTTTQGNLNNLHARFRQHTCKLFEKHGMTNLDYWKLLPDQPRADSTLIYMLAHKDELSAKLSWAAFRADPEWKEIKAGTEAAAGGSLTVPNGVDSLMLKATDYSALK